MAKAGLDAFVTFNLKNIRYLSGFSGSNGAVVVTEKDAVLFTDFRYASQVEEEAPDMTSHVCVGALTEDVGKKLQKVRGKRVGFEEKHVTVALMAELKKHSGSLRWVPSSIIEGLRSIKDAGEIGLIVRNFGLLEKAFSKISAIIRPGKEESAVAAELEYALKLSGGEKPAFDFIVASGARSALPHGVASRKLIRQGDIVILDWGWVLDGYHSDNTRTLFVGKPKPKLREIFEIVLEANMRAIARTAPGVPLKEIDSAARDYISKMGYGKYFGHGTGHGVGLDIHEEPNVSQRSTATAIEGMVFTIEPGIYLPGIGGVRIEDVVAVTASGCKLISEGVPKKLAVIG